MGQDQTSSHDQEERIKDTCYRIKAGTPGWCCLRYKPPLIKGEHYSYPNGVSSTYFAIQYGGILHRCIPNWANYAQKFGKIATVSALGIAVVEFLLLHWISATYSICLSLALAAIELPGAYTFIGPCNNLMDIVNHDLYFHKPIVRTIAYITLSVFLFWLKGFQIITGTLMLATASLYSFAAINSSQLDIDPGLPIPSVPGVDDSTAFGTFA